MGEETKAKEPTIKALFTTMERLAEKPFEYFLSGIGAMLLAGSILAPPWGPLSEWELLLMSVFGLLGLIAGFGIAWQKATLKMQTNIAKLDYKKFTIQQKTERMKLVQQGASKELDLSDLESFD